MGMVKTASAARNPGNRNCISSVLPVSYTHLDVYKRQIMYKDIEKQC